MIERKCVIRFAKAETGQHLFDARGIGVSAAPLELFLKFSITQHDGFNLRRVRHLDFELVQFFLTCDQV